MCYQTEIGKENFEIQSRIITRESFNFPKIRLRYSLEAFVDFQSIAFS